MLYPIRKTDIYSDRLLDLPTGPPPVSSFLSSSSLEGGSNNPPLKAEIDWKGWIADLLISIWSFAKYHLLFFLFDEQEDRFHLLQREIRGFVDLYFEEAVVPSAAGGVKIKERFRELDLQLQDLLFKELLSEIAALNPKCSASWCSSMAKQIIEGDFFLKMGEIEIFAKAVFRTDKTLIEREFRGK